MSSFTFDPRLIRMVLDDEFPDLPRGVVADIRTACHDIMGGGKGHYLPNGFLMDYRTIEQAAARFGTGETSRRAAWQIARRNKERNLYN